MNIGTLLAFVIVCAAVLMMRRTHPEFERPFRAPFVPLSPILGIVLCLHADVFAPGGELAPSRHLARPGHGHLLRLRAQAQRHGEVAARREMTR